MLLAFTSTTTLWMEASNRIVQLVPEIGQAHVYLVLYRPLYGFPAAHTTHSTYQCIVGRQIKL